MKKIYTLSAVLAAFALQAQFSVTIQAPADFKDQDAILYTLNGSKDVVVTKEQSKNNTWTFKYPNNYMGMMKVYFPGSNNTVNFISENKNVSLKLDVQNNKVKDIIYLDEANELMSKQQEGSQKKELILPALSQIKEYYKDNTDFGKALKTEIERLSGNSGAIDAAKHPFISYYNTNYSKFLSNPSDPAKKPSQDEIINFLDKSNDMLETSSLLRPVLVAYLNSGGNTNVTGSVDKLLDRLKVETPRGQTVLSELIDIFDVYQMDEFKSKYLGLAKNLKCTITDRLASTIKSNANVEMGAAFPNYKFQSPVNTTAKSLYDVKADKKVVVFWSSTCSHCETELPKLLEKYNELKGKNIQVVALSLDVDKNSYTKKIAAFPWVNDSELRGWNSSYTETYNVHATPTYFILDANNKIINKPEHVGDVLEYFKLK
ncbi:TlpA family protein disulfide reductase [Chryseobacterium indologenes]|uniref:TlpA family protein disulfide reductase n=1 Tax=Chryseobacterium indologenes TaxID=253 RepID=A0A3G5YVC0_CHRID|nr:TlpA disulfide reductase family protein [Chryseobacterium indologenes]ATN07844.1 TlpA family protein disulfide reductase [Chryseobacterium indologenes]AYY83419.1 TlpA family protein disulfide reductase [Chryseobacterium indologenes]AZB19558.1 TlpA family protein disulfide reductase [Chryseobacterium indologenes]QIX80328.1 TlpA family protein disulfide reductase [Chryseobacterium indologenes]QPQ53774.1 TlpA family protein disulfide reductase [Chryseobacterium indologenes]